MDTLDHFRELAKYFDWLVSGLPGLEPAAVHLHPQVLLFIIAKTKGIISPMDEF